jgi:hypothetical protein
MKKTIQSAIIKRVKKAIIDAAISRLENEKNAPQLSQKHLDVLNSGILIDLNRIRAAGLDLAIKAIRTIEHDF